MISQLSLPPRVIQLREILTPSVIYIKLVFPSVNRSLSFSFQLGPKGLVRPPLVIEFDRGISGLILEFVPGHPDHYLVEDDGNGQIHNQTDGSGWESREVDLGIKDRISGYGALLSSLDG